MGPIWGRQDPDGPYVDPMNFAIWDTQLKINSMPYIHAMIIHYFTHWSFSLSSLLVELGHLFIT